MSSSSEFALSHRAALNFPTKGRKMNSPRLFTLALSWSSYRDDLLQRILILLLSVRTFSVAYYGADLLRNLMYGVGVRNVHHDVNEAVAEFSLQTIGVSLLAYRTHDLGRATRPMVTEFQVVIRFSMSEAFRCLTPTVRETIRDGPEAVTAGKDLREWHRNVRQACLGGRFSGSRPEAHAIKPLFSICYSAWLGPQEGCKIHDCDPAHRMVRDSRQFARRKVVPDMMTAAVTLLEGIAKTV
jgi:hypothetical protein